MLLQTNSYIVPRERRAEHARLMRRFRQILHNLGCDNFEIYEQVGTNWSNTETSGRFVQIMRFRDRKHQLAVQNAERSDPAAQQLIAEFCELVNYPYQQQQGQFAIGFYSSVLPVAPSAGAAEPADVAFEDVPQEQVESAPVQQAEDSAEAAEAEILPEETTPDQETPAEPEPFATESETQAEVRDDEAEVEVEGFIPDEQEQIEGQAVAGEAPVEEEPQEPLPPRPVPSPDADLDADLDIPDDDLARLADELAPDELTEELDRDHAHGHGRHGGAGSENGHS
jgi:hypothetical protein